MRRLFRWNAKRNATAAQLAEYLQIAPRAASILASRLERDGYWRRSDDPSTPTRVFINTEKAERLALATATRPLTRVTADKLVAGLIDRIRALETMPFAYTVEEAHVFGSYLTEDNRLSDIDLAIKLKCKFEHREQQFNFERARIEKSGRIFRDWLDETTWPLNEVRTFLLKRSGYLHLRLQEPLSELPDFSPVRQIYPDRHSRR